MSEQAKVEVIQARTETDRTLLRRAQIRLFEFVSR